MSALWPYEFSQPKVISGLIVDSDRRTCDDMTSLFIIRIRMRSNRSVSSIQRSHTSVQIRKSSDKPVSRSRTAGRDRKPHGRLEEPVPAQIGNDRNLFKVDNFRAGGTPLNTEPRPTAKYRITSGDEASRPEHR